jgi:ribosome maturation factor RimP
VSIVERVRAAVEPLLATQSLTVYDVEHTGSVLRITIDGADGVDLDAIAKATRLISVTLDEQDPIPGKYTLEVSSPGLERSLRTPGHFEGAIGSMVSVKTVPSYEGDRRVKGILRSADPQSITVDDLQLSYDDIDRARTVFEWGPAPKPGKQPAADKKSNAKKAKVP